MHNIIPTTIYIYAERRIGIYKHYSCSTRQLRIGSRLRRSRSLCHTLNGRTNGERSNECCRTLPARRLHNRRSRDKHNTHKTVGIGLGDKSNSTPHHSRRPQAHVQCRSKRRSRHHRQRNTCTLHRRYRTLHGQTEVTHKYK